MTEDVCPTDVIKEVLVIKMSSGTAGQYLGKKWQRQLGQARVKRQTAHGKRR